ncbi:hypothetical protein BDC45DRAFT_533550 [Circinella umbellata]|nr:hypothetical protein BDC45DRAFT_533550 [Circinella umbellata]
MFKEVTNFMSMTAPLLGLMTMLGIAIIKICAFRQKLYKLKFMCIYSDEVLNTLLSNDTNETHRCRKVTAPAVHALRDTFSVFSFTSSISTEENYLTQFILLKIEISTFDKINCLDMSRLEVIDFFSSLLVLKVLLEYTCKKGITVCCFTIMTKNDIASAKSYK